MRYLRKAPIIGAVSAALALMALAGCNGKEAESGGTKNLNINASGDGAGANSPKSGGPMVTKPEHGELDTQQQQAVQMEQQNSNPAPR